MFNPEYRITDYLVQLLGQIAQLQARIEDSPIDFDLLVRLQKQALIKTAKASTTIEGNQLALDQVAALAEHRPVSAELSQKLEVMNYFEALNWVITKASATMDLPQIINVHKMVCAKLLPASKLGVFRVKQNYVVNENKVVIYTPPPAKKVAGMLQDLVEWLYAVKDRHPIITSAIFHHQFVSIHPFSDGNGRTARALAQWILYQQNFDPQHLYYLDNYFAADRDRYYQKITQARDLDGDFTYWIEYVAEGVVSTLSELLAEIRQLMLRPTHKVQLSNRQRKLLGLLRTRGQLASRDIQLVMGINRARVNQLLSPLIAADIVRVSGKGRATSYFLMQ